MSTLLVDLGNSRLKWAEHGPGLWRSGAASLDESDMDSLLSRAWSGIARPQKIVACSVSALHRLVALERWAHQHWSRALHRVHSQAEQLGVKNRYWEPEKLGADRWAALIGARGLGASAACIVDCGTAVTVDALAANGEFLGGVIFPGLRLLRASLTRGTEGVKEIAGDEADCLARSTAGGVAAGTLLGLAGAIERLIEEYRAVLGEPMSVFLTGGDAPRLAARLRAPVTAVPDLVLQGLARIADTL